MALASLFCCVCNMANSDLGVALAPVISWLGVVALILVSSCRSGLELPSISRVLSTGHLAINI